MAPQTLIGLLLGLIAIQAASVPEPAVTSVAPSGTPQTRYCMHVAPVTGNLAETIACWTREEWAEQGVDVDREWAKEGVRTIG